MNFIKKLPIILFIVIIPFIYFSADTDAKPAKKGAVKKAAPKPVGVKRFSLNFKDVEISEFLNIMSGLIGKNIILDDKVRGKITINSSRTVPVSQAYEVMKSILEIKGLAVVESENLIKVIPIKDAIKKNTDIMVDVDKVKKPVPIPEMKKEKTITFLLELKLADADEVANALRTLKSQFSDIVVFRSLNIIIFSGTSSEIDGLIKIAKALDQKGVEGITKTGGGNIHVVHLENAAAEDLANVLSRVPFSETAKINTSPMTPTPQQPQIRPSNKAQRMVQPPGSPQMDKTKLSIIANKETNSLIITATPEEFKEINRVIKELDIVREQVLIEALILEVNVDYSWNFGIDWMLGKSKRASGTTYNRYGGASIMGTPPDYSAPSGEFFKDKKLAIPMSQGFKIGFLRDSAQIGFALLNLSAGSEDINILSTPQLLTVDNQEAELNVGEEISVPTMNRVTDTGQSMQSFEYKSVGIKLKITPHITKKEKITLDLYQEVNSILTSETISADGSTIRPPKLGKRDIKTKVTVYDGKTIVVGGLMRNDKKFVENKVPILGDIPLLGWLFKNKQVSYKKTNLLVFITPHILTKQDKMDALTKQKRDIMRKIRNKKK